MDNSTLGVVALRRTLREVVAWCRLHASVDDPEHCLRTPALRAGPLDQLPTERQIHEPFERRAIAFDEWSATYHANLPAILRERATALFTLARRRHALLHDETKDQWHADVPFTESGRLLANCPEDTLSDGGAWAASGHCFGVDDEPPWDSWIAYLVVEDRRPATYLLSWVPSRLMDVAVSGIEAAIGRSLHWVAEMDAPFAHVLRDTGLTV